LSIDQKGFIVTKRQLVDGILFELMSLYLEGD